MKNINEWLSEYGESHQNKINKMIHWFCVPVIFWSVALMLWSVPVPKALQFHPWLNWATLVLIPVFLFYLLISWKLSIGMLLFSSLVVWASDFIAQNVDWAPWIIGLTIFAIAWIFQFVGHHIEGKKPSFFKDMLFLLIGPAWLMSFIYKKLGIQYA